MIHELVGAEGLSNRAEGGWFLMKCEIGLEERRGRVRNGADGD